MHASKQPSPRTPPETGYVQLVGSNLDGLRGAATKDQGRRLVRGRGWLHRIGELSEWAEHRQQRRRARLISQRHKNPI